MIIDKTSYVSPNFNDRPVAGGIPLVPDMVVIHYTGMKTAKDALERLCDPVAEVSAHYLINETGLIYQLVDPEKRAWHAGVSHWRGRDNINHYSIGIELAHTGHEFGYGPFPDSQINSLVDLLTYLTGRYHIPPENFVGHSDIAYSRKSDPGELFPWHRLFQAGFGVLSTQDVLQCHAEKSKEDKEGKFFVLAGESHRLDALQSLEIWQNLQHIGYEIPHVIAKILQDMGDADGQTDIPNSIAIASCDQELRACIRAFQSRWVQSRYDGIMDAVTVARLKDIAKLLS